MLVNIDTATSAVYVVSFVCSFTISPRPVNSYASDNFITSCMQVCGFRDIRELAKMDDGHPKFRILKKFLEKLRITVKTIGGGKRPKIVYDLIPCAGRYEFPKDDRTTTIFVSVFAC